MSMSTKKRTLDGFFKQPAKKAKVSEDSDAEKLASNSSSPDKVSGLISSLTS